MGSLELYRQMMRARTFELAVADLWRRGLISGEMHLGTGEEAVAAGVVSHLGGPDALALDHRPTPELVIRGVGMVPLLREMLGRHDGLCRGRGGHMHLFSPQHLSASSGIVGSSAPLGVGFALAAKVRRPGAVAVAFFGDGAMNQGMVLEAMNLASVWSLPVLFVCKDNRWAITTLSASVTAGKLLDRARAFGMPATRVDGRRVRSVWRAAGRGIRRARRGKGPTFLLAACPRLDGHFLGDPLVRTAVSPLGEGRRELGRVVRSAITRRGAGLGARAASLGHLVGLLAKARRERRGGGDDPVRIARQGLRTRDARQVDEEVAREVSQAVAAALDGDESSTPGATAS